MDTNVGIVANGRETNASPTCRQAAIDALASILRNGRIVVDAGGEIQREYRNYFNPSGQPGVGDRFYREVLINYRGKVERIDLERRPDGSFVDFPDDPDLAAFDPADRKFAAVARKGGVPVLNATDTDWLNHHDALVRNGISVEFVCGLDGTAWFEP